jgi:hypothetical protein
MKMTTLKSYELYNDQPLPIVLPRQVHMYLNYFPPLAFGGKLALDDYLVGQVLIDGCKDIPT